MEMMIQIRVYHCISSSVMRAFLWSPHLLPRAVVAAAITIVTTAAVSMLRLSTRSRANRGSTPERSDICRSCSGQLLYLESILSHLPPPSTFVDWWYNFPLLPWSRSYPTFRLPLHLLIGGTTFLHCLQSILSHLPPPSTFVDRWYNFPSLPAVNLIPPSASLYIS